MDDKFRRLLSEIRKAPGFFSPCERRSRTPLVRTSAISALAPFDGPKNSLVRLQAHHQNVPEHNKQEHVQTDLHTDRELLAVAAG